jgi:exosome complex component RRP4
MSKKEIEEKELKQIEEKDVKKVEGKKKTVKEVKSKVMVEDRSVAIPGELLASGMGFIPSDGAYRDTEDIRANVLGLVSIRGRVIRVIPLSGRYLPQRGDVVIGVVSEIRHSGWFVDLRSPFVGTLSVSDAVDRYVDLNKENLSKYFNIGDTILAEVDSATDIVHLTMRGPGLRKLVDGQIIDVAPAKVPRIIGKNGSMVKVIREGTGVRMIVGRNGRIWVNGDREAVKKSIKAIDLIDRESHTRGLTDKVREMLQIS